MYLPIRLPAHVFFTIMKFHNNEIHNNERTPYSYSYNSSRGCPLNIYSACIYRFPNYIVCLPNDFATNFMKYFNVEKEQF